ncbi:RNA-guided endonuclease TnpB family protein (plasmid) [Streptomyces sp. QH1-20]|uniref:RNA-guided endonuclease TnpB family protein n=1 Tax=Streptomyces sp. QH1-20 TaxID=3240934 RepID=UPI003510E3A4
MTTETQEASEDPRLLRAYRFALDPTGSQLVALNGHAGAARWAFNHALAVKSAAHREWRREVDALVASGMDEKEARKTVTVKVPKKPEIQRTLNAVKGDSRRIDVPEGMLGPHRPCPWWWQYSTYAFQSAFADADVAFQNWMDSLTGQRAGQKIGYPRFKPRGRCRDSFRLHHDIKNPTIRLDGYRRLLMPRIGSVRLHESGKRLARLVDKGDATIQSVTVARGGHRWYASVLCSVRQELPARPTRAQRERGRVGVDLGVKVLATLDKPFTVTPGTPEQHAIPNERHGKAARRKLTRAQRAYARTTKGSQGRVKAARRIGRIQHTLAEHRATTLHLLTKRLTTSFATIAIEDLHVKGMTGSARGTTEKPGRKVRQKAGLNRSILDASFGEVRRQLTYKAAWYGSSIAICARRFPSSRKCSAPGCDWADPDLTLADRVFRCKKCGLVIDRDLNAARNIAAHAQSVAPGRGETPSSLGGRKRNARGGDTSPTVRKGGRQSSVKREDPADAGPSRRSDPPATLNARKKTA